ncbi:hypothetical protein CASFOL_009409 [Castilleja foliolosa]|uniref:BZIP domain-containing protein n=1 Tax=Castilleja foliolosa TaxID=1961234 RepID=A0ABD3DX94_9LAMI
MDTMNLDEFLNSTWFTGDNQAQPKARGIPRQTSITISELFGSDSDNDVPIPNTKPASPPEEPIFERLSLEEYLFRAGFLDESDLPQAPPPPQQHNPCPNRGNFAVGNNYAARPVMVGGGVNTRVNNQGPAVERVYEGVGAPVLSPVSSDGVGPVQVVDRGSRKRRTGGRGKVVERQLQPRNLETPTERHQRRMIQNRESAARSRAIKQAYTTELEVDKKQLVKENEWLKERVAELEKKLSEQVRKRNQAIYLSKYERSEIAISNKT